jgi:cholesterol transport system auxiliary component
MAENIPPADIYTISSEWNGGIEPMQRIPVSDQFIKLTPIRATGALTGTEIIYTDVQYGRNSYAFSRWNDSPVRLLQTLFQVGLEQSGLFRAVIPSTSTAQAALLLESTLLNFSHQIKNGKTSEGIIRVRFYLIDNKSKRVKATREFVSRIPANSQNAQGAVVALNQAATSVAQDLVDWLAEPDRLSKESLKCSKIISENCDE